MNTSTKQRMDADEATAWRLFYSTAIGAGQSPEYAVEVADRGVAELRARTASEVSS